MSVLIEPSYTLLLPVMAPGTEIANTLAVTLLALQVRAALRAERDAALLAALQSPSERFSNHLEVPGPENWGVLFCAP